MSPRNSCGVANCLYEKYTTLEGFPVCELHDAKQTLAILENLKWPGAFLFKGHPIVLPVGDLEERHFYPEGEGVPLDPDRLAIDWNDRGGHSRFDLLKEFPECL